ncbi:T9SS C-terminal target domain-containing protein, partial [candidate division KSB1 bacterium]|nr:T9SS C-terminal target domain-containing protein [candidate division KSB1 bacterium]
VVPNPYVGSASFEAERFAVSGRGERRMEFRALPANATIRIFTVRGELVQTLRHDGSNDGFVAWDLRTKDNLDIAPGLYIFHVDGNGAGTHIGKFAIIK